MTPAQIEKLLKLDPDKIQNDSMKAAVAEANRLKKEQEAAAVVRHLQDGQDRMDCLLRTLRGIRKEEAECKAKLVKFSEAFDQFMKDGDLVAFRKAYAESEE